MRCYHFCNTYLASIQHGIQSAHAQMELFVKYRDTNTPQHHVLFNWAHHHKTMICLNGGMHKDMKLILEHVASASNPYPWSVFYEDSDAIDGLLTNIAVVLPESFYDNVKPVLTARATNDPTLLTSSSVGWTQWHFEMAELMGRLRLAQ